jgi:hypothetical protein
MFGEPVPETDAPIKRPSLGGAADGLLDRF